MSLQIGPLKPLNAGGARNTAYGGVCLCAVPVCACAIPSGDPPWTQVCVCGSVAGGWFSLTWAR